MSNPIGKQIRREIELAYKKLSDEFSVNYALEFEKRLTTNFINNLKNLKVIEKKKEKIENNLQLETKEIEKAKTKKEIEEFKVKKMEELEFKFGFLELKNKLFKDIDEYEQEQEERKIIIKNWK